MSLNAFLVVGEPYLRPEQFRLTADSSDQSSPTLVAGKAASFELLASFYTIGNLSKFRRVVQVAEVEKPSLRLRRFDSVQTVATDIFHVSLQQKSFIVKISSNRLAQPSRAELVI